MRRFVDKKSPVSEFGNFQMQLKGLTVVTRTFFDKFVSQLEQGFDSMKDEFVGGTSLAVSWQSCPLSLQPHMQLH